MYNRKEYWRWFAGPLRLPSIPVRTNDTIRANATGKPFCSAVTAVVIKLKQWRERVL